MWQEDKEAWTEEIEKEECRRGRRPKRVAVEEEAEGEPGADMGEEAARNFKCQTSNFSLQPSITMPDHWAQGAPAQELEVGVVGVFHGLEVLVTPLQGERVTCTQAGGGGLPDRW